MFSWLINPSFLLYLHHFLKSVFSTSAVSSRLSENVWAERFCFPCSCLWDISEHYSCLNVCKIDLHGAMMCSVRVNESDKLKRSLVCLYKVHRKMNEGCFTLFSCSDTFTQLDSVNKMLTKDQHWGSALQRDIFKLLSKKKKNTCLKGIMCNFVLGKK